MANKYANKVPMAERLVWARVMRPRAPIVYIDLNHFIGMARANTSDARDPRGYRELLDSARRATQQGRALVPLSGQHFVEMIAINDPRQRKDVADVMEELSGFQYLMGRPEIAQLEIEAGIEKVLDETEEPMHLPLIGPSFGWAFGMRGGVKITDAQGEDTSTIVRKQMGAQEFEAMMRKANHYLERHMLEGPSDEDAEKLRAEHGYDPEAARAGERSRLDFELDLSKRLEAEPRWRRGRLRDVVSGREIAHEWLDMINRVNQERVRAGRPLFDPGDARWREFMAAMPHTQVAISMKTRYHRDPEHRWTTNDIVDIDAMSVAYAYCDVAFTDKAARAALTSSTELRVFETYVPRTPTELSEWFDEQPRLATGHLLVPAGAGAGVRAGR